MHLVRFTHQGRSRAGALFEDRVIDVSALGCPPTIEGWLEVSPETFTELVARVTASAEPAFALANVRLEAPISAPRKLVAIGVNYLDHCREQGIEPPQEPLVFGKFPSTIIGPFDTITWDPTLTHQVDPEVELGVVIGKRCRAVTADEALAHVFGYTVVNDVSARDLQFGDGQWTRGKSLDTFCPLGPAIVTTDELADPQALHLRLWVNDRLQQDGTTADMIFSVAEIIAHVSRFATLEPGDLIITGTPNGVGCFRQPPIYLAPGDVVRCCIDGIGELVNPTHAGDADDSPASGLATGSVFRGGHLHA
jgi:2-keto-4-pentenoate hydratase/2-oxohepta-3-ene-1,7-dioic acid hydratase in catechol pathway